LREKLPDWWSPIMPTCEKCGKNATTRVIKHNIFEYEYACDRDVGYTKGCGYLGKAKISDHLYKLTWRLHWPAWQDYFKTSAEGGGVDHFTRGGSRDSLEVIFREIFKKEPPIGYKFGFILFNGKKYSKSKGQGIGISELMQLLPPEIIKYMLLKPDLQENIDIVPSGKNFLRLIEDYEKALELIAKDPNLLSKADRKRMLAAKLSSEKQKIRGWKTSFLDLILYRNLQLSWDKIAQKTDENSVQKLSFYIENWEKKNFIPDEYQFKYSPKKISTDSFVYKFFANLETKMSAVDIHNFAFVCAKETNISPAKFFEECYLVLLRKPVGPKLGKLIEAIGIEKVKADLL
jgi:lysyl-tRNA synthetase class 1